MNEAKFVEGYNAQVNELKVRYRAGSSAYDGYEAARTVILRSQIEHNKYPVLKEITKADIPQVLQTERENNNWFARQVGMPEIF